MSTSERTAPPEREARLADEIASRALEALYRAFYDRLVRHVTWHYGLSREDSQEVVQDAFLLAAQKLELSGNPKAWLYRVTGNLASNWKRKAQRRRLLLAEWGPRPGPARNEEGGS